MIEGQLSKMHSAILKEFVAVGKPEEIVLGNF